MSLDVGCDFLVVGGGIAGASAAYFLAPRGRTVLLERESQCGYHSTGRSAAQYIATYGPPQVRSLSIASRPFLDTPPAGFADTALLHPRAVLTVAAPGQESALQEAWHVLSSVSDRGLRLDAAAACARMPVLRPERVAAALLEPDAFDMDVHALHQGFLRGVTRGGGRIVTDAEVDALGRHGARWHLRTRAATYIAPVVINAAGAWGDELARLAGVLPLGLQPLRRSAFTFRPPEGLMVADWPLVVGAGHDYYFKPDAGMLLGSPANSDPTAPQDVQPEEIDIALAMDRIETATTMTVRPARRWAGLRSFVGDGEMVCGFDADAEGFFWCVGQGGYGIQTSPAMGQTCAALACGDAVPLDLAVHGVSGAALSPARLRAVSGG